MYLTSTTPTIWPPLIKMPVDKASPTGKVSSQANSKEMGITGVVKKPMSPIAIPMRMA